MTALDVTPIINDGDWADRLDMDRRPDMGTVEAIGNVPRAMSSGLPATQILGRTEEGHQVILQVSYVQLMTAVSILHSVWGHPQPGDMS